MKKYPNIDVNEIKVCIKEISMILFNTYDFIEVWSSNYPKSHNYFSSIGIGWKRMVGKNLSKNSGKHSTYQILKGKKSGGAQLWKKY